jgi:hypothetical protein
MLGMLQRRSQRGQHTIGMRKVQSLPIQGYLSPALRRFKRLFAEAPFLVAFRPLFRGGSAEGPHVCLLTSPGSLGLRQTHPAQQIGVARVGVHPVPEDVYT